MSKDIMLPKLYTELRKSLLMSGWTISHSDANDTYVVLDKPESAIACIIHYMPEAKNVYPNGSFLLKIRADEDTIGKWQTCTMAIDDSIVSLFTHHLKNVMSIYSILKSDIETTKDPF